MNWPDWTALIACGLGGGLGAYAMINPAWASKLVRLVPSEGKVEGKSEFRATYGGLFLLAHAFAAWAVATAQSGADLATATLGAAWLGSALGRLLSFALDKTATPVNWFNIVFEALLSALLLSPLLFG